MDIQLKKFNILNACSYSEFIDEPTGKCQTCITEEENLFTYSAVDTECAGCRYFDPIEDRFEFLCQNAFTENGFKNGFTSSFQLIGND